MTQPLPDQQARLLALNPKQSFIVQAPAGSGKTALLIARMLSLLATCQQPEQILAITFTRKAANEMRERIMHALSSATLAIPEAPHAQHIWHLAQAVLAQDQRHNWQLMDNPNRLRVQTIDAFCTQVTQQMPITSEIGGQTGMLTQASTLYEQAADSLLYQPNTASPWHQALSTLLLHLDGNILTTKRLLVTMLGCRDQWLPYLIGHQAPAQLKRILEDSLQNFIQQQLNTLSVLLPKDLHPSLHECLAYSHSMTSVQPTKLPQTHSLAYWQKLAELLLTKQHQWRKTVTKKQGFFAASHFSSKADKDLSKSMKSLIKDILDQCQDKQALRDQLQLISMAPTHGYDKLEWNIIESLCQVLPVLAAQLSLLFKQHNVADFTEISIKALQALASHEQPSEIALALDRRIEHILMDEFQDTSITQFRLLEALTMGWMRDDGRTLFVVGDPMQSIYRFRQAEVSLFEQLRQHGIHHIKPTFLSLQTNFRSDPSVVAWINQQCQTFFPPVHQADLGAIPFYPSRTPQQTADTKEQTITQCHICTGSASSQAHTIAKLILAEKERNATSEIAILVRSRNHLKHIIPQLEVANIAYQAVEIQSLSEHPITQDLISLTRALFHLADRTAWLAILRAPWCGLSLNDMLVLARNHETTTIWQQMNDAETQASLSEQGLLRLQRILNPINNAISQRGRCNLRDSVAETWYELGGPHCYTDPQPGLIANAYLDHLESFLTDNKHYSPSAHALALQALYAPNPSPEAHAVQIMTIHKSKGLEFDCVIIPDCHRSGANDAQQLMLWQQNITSSQHNLMLAPLPPKNQKQTCYHLLQYLEKCKQRNEIKRLLYVALTRAKHSLHCLAQAKETPDDDSPVSAPKGSLMALLAPAFAQAEHHHHEINPEQADNESGLWRLSDTWKHPSPMDAKTPAYDSANRYQAEQPSVASIIGTVIHHVLWQLSHGMPLNNQNQWQQLLHHYQCPIKHHAEALLDIELCVKNMLNDPKGQWILQAHPQAKSEVAISSASELGYVEHVIDRTFIHEGKRWIIDYKCGSCDTSIKEFVHMQYLQHRAQLEHYANIYHATDNTPIMLMLYFPRYSAWHAWPHHATTNRSTKHAEES